MISANVIEKELRESIERFIVQADLNEFANSIGKLNNLGYNVHIKVNPDKKLYNFQLNHCIAKEKLVTEKETLRKLVLAEKHSAIRSQDFELAVRLSDFENEIENISGEEACSALEAITNMNFECSIVVYNREIFIVIQTELRLFKHFEDKLLEIASQKYLLKIENIEEKVVESIKLSDSTQELLKQNYETVDENGKVYVASVSQNGLEEVLYLQAFSSLDQIPVISLKQHLKAIDCSDIRFLTLLCTYYDELDKPLLPYIGIKNPIIDEILSDSLGWLAYPHQLIALFSIATGINSKKKNDKFVEDFNNSNLREIEVYLGRPLLGFSLGEIVNERILSKQENLRLPNYYYGFKLFEFLKK